MFEKNTVDNRESNLILDTSMVEDSITYYGWSLTNGTILISKARQWRYEYAFVNRKLEGKPRITSRKESSIRGERRICSTIE